MKATGAEFNRRNDTFFNLGIRRVRMRPLQPVESRPVLRKIVLVFERCTDFLHRPLAGFRRSEIPLRPYATLLPLEGLFLPPDRLLLVPQLQRCCLLQENDAS